MSRPLSPATRREKPEPEKTLRAAPFEVERTFGTRASRGSSPQATDVKLVQAPAGHAHPLITLTRYSHLLDTRVTEAAQRFDPARIP